MKAIKTQSYIKHKLINYLIFVLGSFLLECMSLAFMRLGFFPTYFFLDLFLIMIIGCPIFFFKNIIFDCIYYSVLLLFFTLVLLLNVNYYLATGSIFSLTNLSKIKNTDREIFNHITWYTVVVEVIFTLLLIAGLIVFSKLHKYKQPKDRKKLLLICAGSALLVGGLYPLSLFLSSKYEVERKNNLTINAPVYASTYNFKTLGVISYYIKESSYILAGSTKTNEQLKQYYLDSKLENNDFTNFFKDDKPNIISIMIETGDRYMVNQYTTPTLYEFLNTGINCTSNYSKNMTGDAELLGLIGNISTTKTNALKNISLPFTLPNMLKENGYKTYYAHDFGKKHDLYNRTNNMPAVGFETCYFHDELYPGVEEWGWSGNYSLDSITAENIIELLSSVSSPFYLHFTSLTMHFPYTKTSDNEEYINALKTKYKSTLDTIKANKEWVNPFENTSYSDYVEDLDIYMMKCMDFDLCLKNLLNKYKSNTLFVLYGDHEIYGKTHDKKYPIKQLLKNKVGDIKNIDLYDTVLSFYHPDLNDKYKELKSTNEFTKFTSLTNIVPTILDLLGIKYSPKMYLSSSIFSNSYNENNILYSYELSTFMNKHYLSETGFRVDKTFNNNNTKTQFIASCNEYLNRQLNIDCIYKNNTFKTYNYFDFIPKT